MKADELHESLRKTGKYETAPEPRRSLLNRLFGNVDAWYFAKLVRIVCSGYRKAIAGEFDDKVWAEHSAMIINAIENCGGRISITGAENLWNLNKPRVYIANHMSMAETFLLPSILLAFGPLTTILKESLIRYPLFGVICQSIDPVKVGRQDPRADLVEVMTKGEQILKQGRSIFVFPQATRSVVFDIGTFNSLGVKLAARGGVDVVPIALKTDYHGIGKFIKEFGPVDMSKTVYVKIGPPISAGGNQRETQEKVVRFITDNLKQWGARVIEGKK
jgi:1-acyl-sn-glycerol-3-phosphate acyltransferase